MKEDEDIELAIVRERNLFVPARWNEDGKIFIDGDTWDLLSKEEIETVINHERQEYKKARKLVVEGKFSSFDEAEEKAHELVATEEEKAIRKKIDNELDVYLF